MDNFNNLQTNNSEFSTNESSISNFPSSSTYQQFADNINDEVARSSTFVTSNIGLGLIIEKFKHKNRKIHETTEHVRKTYNDRKKKFEKILGMYERQQEKSKRNLELYRERQATCFEEMRRLEGIVQALRGKLSEAIGESSEDEIDLRNVTRDGIEE